MTNSSNQIDRFRGWAVTCLYCALGLFSILIALAVLRLWPHIQGYFALKSCTFIASLLAIASCTNSCLHFAKVMKAKVGIPRLHIPPFLLVMIMLALAGKLFASI